MHIDTYYIYERFDGKFEIHFLEDFGRERSHAYSWGCREKSGRVPGTGVFRSRVRAERRRKKLLRERADMLG